MKTIQTGEATYCPEDDKLRLYVGRVDRATYLELRAEGWKSTPKQSCDFVASWSPHREAQALSMCGDIGDEDQSPEDRAADRAQRFAGYRDKRLAEARGHADAYDSQPLMHGSSDRKPERAERAARRHNRMADRAVSAWDKADYWVSRTRGVIRHRLYVSRPDVRERRIKRLESELRVKVASYTGKEHTGSDGQRYIITGKGRNSWATEIEKIPAIRAAAEPWERHLRNRIAYELQMQDAYGGMSGEADIEVGGFFGRRQVLKVNRSRESGRVVSVGMKGDPVKGWAYRAKNDSSGLFAVYTVPVEEAGAYRAPTDEERAEFETWQAEIRAAKKVAAKKAPAKPKLINPTDEDAERLQAILNKDNAKRGDAAKVIRTTQARYSQLSQGAYSLGKTRLCCEGGAEYVSSWRFQPLPVCKVRVGRGDGGQAVIILTDKPQKPLPAELFDDPRPKYQDETRNNFSAIIEGGLMRRDYERTTEQRRIMNAAVLSGWFKCGSCAGSELTYSERGRSEIMAELEALRCKPARVDEQKKPETERPEYQPELFA